MRKLSIAVALLVLLSSAALLRAAEFQQYWLYGGGDCSTDAGTQKFIDLLKRCKDNGVNVVTFGDGMSNHLDRASAGYFQNVKRVMDEAKQDHITLVPQVYSIGYGGSYFAHDSNLAAGIPARKVPFIVKGGVADADPEAVPTIINANFDDVKDGKPVGWTVPADVAGCFSADAGVHHGDSGASVKISNLESLTAKGEDRAVHFSQELNGVKPFQYYRLSFWIKTERKGAKPDEKFASAEEFTHITSSGGKRRNTYKNIDVPANSDWTRYEITLNTFEVPDGKLMLTLGVGDVGSGTIWFDDVKLEQAGMVLLLRRPIKPLVVTSQDGATTYTEGQDFEPVSDPIITQKPFPGEFPTDHPAPKLVLTKNSRIKEGQRLSVSFFHAMRIYDDQDVFSMQDPEALVVMEEQIKNMAKAWPTGHYFMGHDEIRITGWEGDASETPGQILAKNAKAGYDLIKKYSPDATVYAWSDMYTPYHNGRPFSAGGYYYLCNGTYDDSIQGLPKDVVIVNWYSPDNKTPRFFADRGYKQVLAGFYDGTTTEEMKGNITTWMKATEGVPGIVGMMYTTWHANYEQVPEYFKLVKEYPNFGAAPAAAPKDH